MECQREESGALLCDSLLFFQQPVILPSPLIYATTNLVEERHVFVSPMLTRTVGEKCSVSI